MAYEFKLPDLGEGLTEGEVARWLVSEGQEIVEDEPLVEIATDKTTVEIPSPAAGTVTQILVPERAVDLKRLVPLALKAVAAALQEFPELNARIDGSDLVLLDRYDIGVAVQTEQGLVVPVVRGCDTRSLDELDADVRRLADAAHAGKLAPDELRGTTFSITSAGRSRGIPA